MTLSTADICNMAISHVGDQNTIETIGENSPEARQCNLWFDMCRKQALKAHNWNFARKRDVLALHADDAPEAIWTFRYQYPSDALVIRELQNPLGPDADEVPFEVEISADGTMSIVTDLEDAIAVYTFDQTATELFSEEYVDCLSHLLAYRIAMPLTGDKTVKEEELNIYTASISRQPAVSANEGAQRKPREAESIRARNT